MNHRIPNPMNNRFRNTQWLFLIVSNLLTLLCYQYPARAQGFCLEQEVNDARKYLISHEEGIINLCLFENGTFLFEHSDLHLFHKNISFGTWKYINDDSVHLKDSFTLFVEYLESSTDFSVMQMIRFVNLNELIQYEGTRICTDGFLERIPEAIAENELLQINEDNCLKIARLSNDTLINQLVGQIAYVKQDDKGNFSVGINHFNFLAVYSGLDKAFYPAKTVIKNGDSFALTLKDFECTIVRNLF